MPSNGKRIFLKKISYNSEFVMEVTSNDLYVSSLANSVYLDKYSKYVNCTNDFHVDTVVKDGCTQKIHTCAICKLPELAFSPETFPLYIEESLVEDKDQGFALKRKLFSRCYGCRLNVKKISSSAQNAIISSGGALKFCDKVYKRDLELAEEQYLRKLPKIAPRKESGEEFCNPDKLKEEIKKNDENSLVFDFEAEDIAGELELLEEYYKSEEKEPAASKEFNGEKLTFDFQPEDKQLN